MKNKNFLILFILILSAVFSCGAFSASEIIDLSKDKQNSRALSADDCVVFSVKNSFEAKLAKLDFLIAETDKLYAEAVFDTMVFGDVSYQEDKRQPLSVFAGDDSQTNIYSFGASKELPTGTLFTATWSDTRDWVNSAFVSTNPSHAAELAFEVSQPVGKNFFGYIDRNTVTVTKLAIKNASLEMKEKIEDLIADTEKGYWELVYTQRVVEIGKDLLEKAKKLHNSNVKNYDLGLIEKADLLASEANVLIKEKDLMIARDNYRRTEENLKLLMNMAAEKPLTPKEVFSDEPEEFDFVECLKTAFDRRRDYKIRKRDVEIMDITLKMKANAKWPEIDLKGTFAMNGIEGKFDKAAGKTTVADNTYYYAGVEFNMPLENSLARSEYQKASHEKEKAIVDLKRTERSIITEIGNSFRNVNTLNVTARSMNKAVELQSEKLQEEAKRFKYGRSKTKTLIDYMNDLRNTEMQEAIELLAREKARVNLERDMSVLLSKYEELL